MDEGKSVYKPWPELVATACATISSPFTFSALPSIVIAQFLLAARGDSRPGEAMVCFVIFWDLYCRSDGNQATLVGGHGLTCLSIKSEFSSKPDGAGTGSAAFAEKSLCLVEGPMGAMVDTAAMC